jgi:hypothetical protein
VKRFQSDTVLARDSCVGETDKPVNVIGHDQPEAAPPSSRMVCDCCVQQVISDRRGIENVPAAFGRADCNEERRTAFYPRGRGVMQLWTKAGHRRNECRSSSIEQEQTRARRARATRKLFSKGSPRPPGAGALDPRLKRKNPCSEGPGYRRQPIASASGGFP